MQIPKSRLNYICKDDIRQNHNQQTYHINLKHLYYKHSSLNKKCFRKEKQMLLNPNATDRTKTRFFNPHIRKISKVVSRKLMSGICCMKPVRTFITSAC